MQARVVIGITVIVGLVAYLSFLGFEEGKAYYLTCDEVAERQGELKDHRIKLAGNVVAGTIQQDGDILNFDLEYEGVRYSVRYVGMDPVPDTFKAGVEAVVDGHLGEDGVFTGQRIQAKCASKYEKEYEAESEEHPESVPMDQPTA
jgi:cytochrome c-type biogenesis protein CcmE